jgi:hypothetical protein
VLKKDITFDNLDGEKVTKTFYFNLSKSELVTLQAEEPGGFVEKLRFIMMTEDTAAVLAVFKLMVDLSVGERGMDNIQFVKTPEVVKAFKQTAAYDELLFEMIQDPKKAVEFIAGIMPAEFRDKVNTDQVLAQAVEAVEARKAGLETDDIVQRQVVARGPKTLTEFTVKELQAMPTDELKERIKNAGGNVPKAALLEAFKRSE